jgi:phage regulator Rha-like protein/mRNA-degrading endonuclease toxin of MazEF toxin-antitoxin module
MEVKRGDIYYADLSPVVGSEQGGVRPVLVIQNDVGNKFSSTVIVASITSVKKDFITHVTIGLECGLKAESKVELEQIRTIDKRRLREKVGHVPPEVMARVDEKLDISFGRTKEKEGVMNLTIVNRDGQFTIDSREVAEMTDKRHDHLLRDIDGYIEIMENPILGNGSTIKVSDFFIPSIYESGTPTREYRCFLLTRKGCDMVANKMTGEKGVLFTAAYVTKFEEMEQQIAKPRLPQNYAEALRELADSWEANEREKQLRIEAENKVAELEPKGDYYDDMVERNHLTNFRDTAKELKMKESDLIEVLEISGYIYRDLKGDIKPHAQYVPKLFEIKEFVARNGFAGSQTMITHAGREKFRVLAREGQLCLNR